MEESWLDDPVDEWMEVIDPEGETLGYLLRTEVNKLGLLIHVIETPERYLTDPWVLYHAQLAKERGILSDGRDLNDVQVTLLASSIIKKREFEKADRERIFEERLFTSDADRFHAYRQNKEREEEVEADIAEVEQRVPRSIEEFLADLSSFSSEDDSATQDKGQDKAEGWLTSFLDDSDLNQMSDE